MEHNDAFKNLLKKIAKAETGGELNDLVFEENGIGWNYAYDAITEEELDILYSLVNCHKASTIQLPVGG